MTKRFSLLSGLDLKGLPKLTKPDWSEHVVATLVVANEVKRKAGLSEPMKN